jgi:hypothetical protein
MNKQASPQFQILGSTSVSSTTTITSSATGMLYRDSICYQINASGSPIGTININASADYTPGNPQGPQGLQSNNAGNWASIASTSVIAGTAFPIIWDIGPISMPWTQVQFVSSTSSGVISVWTSAKSYG